MDSLSLLSPDYWISRVPLSASDVTAARQPRDADFRGMQIAEKSVAGFGQTYLAESG
jgi:hypothetical protein